MSFRHPCTQLTTSLHLDLGEAPYRRQLRGVGWPRGHCLCGPGACVTAYQGFDNNEAAVAPCPPAPVSINTEHWGAEIGLHSAPFLLQQSLPVLEEKAPLGLSEWGLRGQVGLADSVHTVTAPGGTVILCFSRLF